MRVLEEIERELAAAKKELAEAEGTRTEVYSRIVGYYRSVRNWNKGKLEEYGERKLFRVGPECACDADLLDAELSCSGTSGADSVSTRAADSMRLVDENAELKLVLFVRKSCPACPGAKAAAEKLGIPLEQIDAGTIDGYEKALSHGVYATPTAIMFDRNGMEQGRAYNAGEIASLPALAAIAPRPLQERIAAAS